MFVDKYETRKRALLEAVHFCGGVTKLAKRVGANRSQASNWVNDDVNIPYQYVVLIEEITGISVERLAPDFIATNAVIRSLYNANTIKTISVPIDKIIRNNSRCIISQNILVTTELCLISGINKLRGYHNNGQNDVPVLVVDLEALILGIRNISGLKNIIAISDQVAIAQEIEQLLGNNQGQRRDLQQPFNKKFIISEQLLSICSDVNGITDGITAKLAGFSSRDTYRRAKTVINQGIPALTVAMNQKAISISKAATIAKLPATQQKIFLENCKTINQREVCLNEY